MCFVFVCGAIVYILLSFLHVIYTVHQEWIVGFGPLLGGGVLFAHLLLSLRVHNVHHWFQGGRHQVFRHVAQMFLHVHRVEGPVVSKRLQIAWVFLKERLWNSLN